MTTHFIKISPELCIYWILELLRITIDILDTVNWTLTENIIFFHTVSYLPNLLLPTTKTIQLEANKHCFDSSRSSFSEKSAYSANHHFPPLVYRSIESRFSTLLYLLPLLPDYSMEQKDDIRILLTTK